MNSKFAGPLGDASREQLMDLVAYYKQENNMVS